MSEMSDDRPRVSTRDHDMLRGEIEKWLGTRVTAPSVSALVVPPTNGMSSETLLFDADWTSDGGARVSEQCVLRLPPEAAAEPVFAVYDMPKQYRAMELVGAKVGVPVPPLLWLEEDPAHLGAPFFVMRRVDGLVPPDVMPYTFGDNWFFDASAEDQRRLMESSVEVVARIHSIAADDPDAAFLAIDAPGDTALRRHVNDQRAFYEWVCSDGVRSPLIEAAFDWLDAHWPDEGPAVVSWGDSRVGNIMYRDFTPAAVLDWEMAAHGPREMDLGWMIFLHRFFQDLAELMGLPGLPEFMHPDDVSDVYEDLTGIRPRDLRFYMMYAALRHAIVMFRITRRQVRFGEATMPDNPDEAFIHHTTVRAMIDGSYWPRLGGSFG